MDTAFHHKNQAEPPIHSKPDVELQVIPNPNLLKALEHAESGIHVFPCRSKDEVDPNTGEVIKGKEAKTPLTLHGFKDATTNPSKISSWWHRWPDALPAAATGKINGIAVADLDRKNGKDWAVSAQKAGLVFPDTHTQPTPSGGEHRIYRYPPGVEKIASGANLFKNLVGSEKTGIDIRVDGGYIILWGDLSPEIIADCEEWPTAIIEDAFRRDREAGQAQYERKQAPRQTHPGDLERAKDALETVPADDYDTWVKVGMALKSEFGESGREAWEGWSCTSTKSKGCDLGKKWRSFNGAGIGIGTLFDIAKQNGYQPPKAGQNFSQNSQNSRSQTHEKSTTAWGDPEPLVSKVDAWPYPVDAFPDGMRNAIREAHEIIKLPIEMAGNCALSSLSITAQGLADVKRLPNLTGPISLFLLAVAESGDRKTRCDKWYTEAVLAFQQEQKEKLEPELREFRSAFKAWKAKGAGIEAAISAAAKKGDPTAALYKKLSDHEWDEPHEPRVPDLIRMGDDSSEELAFRLAKKWPSVGIISAEAGSVFGGLAMSSDRIMKTLSLQNVIWDGGRHQVGRRTSECFEVRGARLTIGLQVQEAVLREFCKQFGSLARGIGFFARFLFAWPPSMQGDRFILDVPPDNPPAALAFNRRLSELINLPVSMDGEGALMPILLDMSEDARATWIRVYNDIEKELRPCGELSEIRDVASKAAENVARIAALFHIYQHGVTGRIEPNSILSAAEIVTWHLNEARRFLGEFSMATELADAARIEDWLIKHCRKQGRGVNITLRSTLQVHGPHGLRKKKELDAALEELIGLNRIRLVPNGNKKEIHINPALFEAGQ